MVHHYKLFDMKLQIFIQSFYITLSFSLCVILVIVFTNIYFDLNYLISPTFNLIKWTGLNIIITHLLYMSVLIMLMKFRLFANFNFYSCLISLILISISLIYSIVCFYDFLKFQ